jgi:hypothetical protein
MAGELGTYVFSGSNPLTNNARRTCNCNNSLNSISVVMSGMAAKKDYGGAYNDCAAGVNLDANCAVYYGFRRIARTSTK